HQVIGHVGGEIGKTPLVERCKRCTHSSVKFGITHHSAASIPAPSSEVEALDWTYVDLTCHHQAMSDTMLVSVGPKGRVVIPAQIRLQLRLEEGSELVALVEGDGVLLIPRAAVKRRLRSMFAGVKTSLADELIA